MGLFKSKISTNELKCPLIFLDGINLLAPQTQCIIYLDENNIIIETMNNAQKFEISFSQIINIQQLTERQVSEKNKSVIKRGIAGNLLMGPTGALIGGLSGVGTKEVSQLVYALVITYKSTNSNEINTLTFRSLNHNICNDIVKNVNDKMPKEKNNIKL